MLCPGFEIFDYGIYDSRVVYAKSVTTPPRHLKRFELELVTEDLEGYSHINQAEYALKKGLFICGKPGHRRWSRLPTRCYYVHLQTQDPGLCALLEKLPDACRLSDFSAVEQIFLELVALPYPRDVAGSLQVQSLVSSLLMQVSRQTARELHTDSTVSRSHRAIMMETETFIRTHLAEPLTLEQLSGRVRFSPSHFHTIFTAWFGKTPHEFVLECRIDGAKASLRADRCSMIEIAGDCGFSSQSHFCAQFKKATGQTPLQYRKAKLSRLEL